MAYTLRKNRNGTQYFSFCYTDPKTRKKIRLPKRRTFHIRTEAEAFAFQKQLDGENEAVRLRIERKLAWKTQYYDLAALTAEFTIARQQTAPNSWKNSIFYLEQYIVPFFISQPGGNNLNLWSERFGDFRDHLLVVERVKFNGPLAYNTRNHIITTLNSFLDWAASRRKCEKQEKMALFPDHMMNVRTIEDIYSEEEFNSVYLALKEKSEDEAELFYVLRHTGLRLNEALGLSLDDFILGEPDRPEFKRLFREVEITCRGYIFLRSQPALKQIRDQNGRVPRKDLKHKAKKRSEDKFRIIPIPEGNKDLFNILAKRVNIQRATYKAKHYGVDKADYLLFGNLNRASFDRHLREACFSCKMPTKSSHCLRHTYATELAGLSNSNTRLARMILGHTRQETTDRYDHIFGLLNKAAASQRLASEDEDIELII